MDGWNTSFLLGWPLFRGELLVSGSVYPCDGGCELKIMEFQLNFMVNPYRQAIGR